MTTPTTAETSAAASAFVATRRFRAFISYSTDPDYRLSRRIESFVEDFHRQKFASTISLPPIQVCRDGSDFIAQRARASLPADQSIRTLIERYLDESEYLVVLCSAKACASKWVAAEIEWFLAHRGADRVLLVVSEGRDPAANPAEVFPKPILDAGLHHEPYYDLRGFRGRQSRSWIKVRDSDEELVNLATRLHGETSGNIMPLWHRETLEKARRERVRFGGLALLFALIAGIALWQRNVARDALAQSRARALVLEGEANIQRDPELSILLGLEAFKRVGTSSGNAVEAIASLIRRAAMASPILLVKDVGDIETFELDSAGKRLAIGTHRTGVDVIAGIAALARISGDTAVHTVIRQRIPDGGWVNAVAWSGDGQFLAIATNQHSVLVWDAARDSIVHTVDLENQPQSVSWRRSTRELAVGIANGESSRIQVYDSRSWQMKFAVPGMHGTWSPDGSILASGHVSGKVALFDTTGHLIAEMPEQHTRYVHDLAWHPSGRMLATASVDNSVIVWDATAHRMLRRLASDFALSAAWSPDGRLLASGSGERLITVWDASTWQELSRLSKSTTIAGDTVEASGSGDYITHIGWTNDSRYLIALDRSGSIRLYSSKTLTATTTPEWIEAAKDHTSRRLTPAECRRFLGGGC
jgi:hypothetical protein